MEPDNKTCLLEQYRPGDQLGNPLTVSELSQLMMKAETLLHFQNKVREVRGCKTGIKSTDNKQKQANKLNDTNFQTSVFRSDTVDIKFRSSN